MARLKTRKKKSAAKPARRRLSRRAPVAHATEASFVAYAHDIRTTLTGILALGELLASSNLGERERRWASDIKASAEHLASLTTLMIDAARADAGPVILREEVFRPRRLVDVLAALLSSRAETKGLTAELTVATALPEMLVGDAVRLRAALENLIDNAVKFTERGAVRVDVRATRASRERVKLVFTVTDSGIGLTPAEIRRLGRPFTQANADIARRYGGTGLGLAVVKRLAKRMGGDLSITSKDGRGSSFRFSAVLSPGAEDKAENTLERRPAAPPRRLTVLCVEDNPYGRVILNTILAELGHRADFAGSGEEAIAAVSARLRCSADGHDASRDRRSGGDAPDSRARGPRRADSDHRHFGAHRCRRRKRGAIRRHECLSRKPLSPSALSEALAAVAPAASPAPGPEP